MRKRERKNYAVEENDDKYFDKLEDDYLNQDAQSSLDASFQAGRDFKDKAARKAVNNMHLQNVVMQLRKVRLSSSFVPRFVSIDVRSLTFLLLILRSPPTPSFSTGLSTLSQELKSSTWTSSTRRERCFSSTDSSTSSSELVTRFVQFILAFSIEGYSSSTTVSLSLRPLTRFFPSCSSLSGPPLLPVHLHARHHRRLGDRVQED